MGRFIGGKIGKVVKYVTNVIGESAVYDIHDHFYLRKEGGMTPPPFESSGGTEYTPGNGYKYHVFGNTNGTAVSGVNFSIDNGETHTTERDSLEVLIVAGGACNVGPYQGGGGAGGVIRTPFPTPGTGTYPVVVGAKKEERGNGNDSTVGGHPLGTLTANGGGVGGQYSSPQSGAAGGSGGGVQDSPGTVGPGNQPTANPAWIPLSGFSQYGSPGGDGRNTGAYHSGGGGGAGSQGGQAYPPATNAAGGHGGAGVQMPGFEYPLIGLSSYTPAYISNSPTNNHYGGGGSGWGYQLQPLESNYKAAGGGGVGNNGAPSDYHVPGINMLGGGGGGNSGNGGSGIVVFRYQLS